MINTITSHQKGDLVVVIFSLSIGFKLSKNVRTMFDFREFLPGTITNVTSGTSTLKWRKCCWRKTPPTEHPLRHAGRRIWKQWWLLMMILVYAWSIRNLLGLDMLRNSKINNRTWSSVPEDLDMSFQYPCDMVTSSIPSTERVWTFSIGNWTLIGTEYLVMIWNWICNSTQGSVQAVWWAARDFVQGCSTLGFSLGMSCLPLWTQQMPNIARLCISALQMGQGPIWWWIWHIDSKE